MGLRISKWMRVMNAMQCSIAGEQRALTDAAPPIMGYRTLM